MNNGMRIAGNKPRNFEQRSLERKKENKKCLGINISLPKTVDEHQYERGQNKNKNKYEHQYEMK